MYKSDIYLTINGKEVRYETKELLILESDLRYINILTDRGKCIHETALEEMEKILDPMMFCRIHRSYIVSLKRIDYVEKNIVRIGNRELPIGKVFQKNFNDRRTIIK